MRWLVKKNANKNNGDIKFCHYYKFSTSSTQLLFNYNRNNKYCILLQVDFFHELIVSIYTVQSIEENEILLCPGKSKSQGSHRLFRAPMVLTMKAFLILTSRMRRCFYQF